MTSAYNVPRFLDAQENDYRALTEIRQGRKRSRSRRVFYIVATTGKRIRKLPLDLTAV